MAENFLAVRGSSDTADLDSRALGFEAAVVDDITSAGEMSAAMVERPLRPQLPPQNAHLDEVSRLMKELDEIRKEKRQGEEITYMMARDLDIAQEEVQKKDDELREANERAGIQIAELQKRAQEAESSLQEHTSRMEVEMDQENLLKRIHSLEAEVQDQRKACGWFKKNSERLSREIKETQASRTVLEQSEYAVKRQLAELKSQVTALQQRPRVLQRPGSF
ncbi:hypothetical protein MMC22_006212 [Lobaria immixta]|nr:hypothetical protein [Lobaria immixta]